MNPAVGPVSVYEHTEGDELLDVYAHVSIDGDVVLDQGGDRIVIPMQAFGRFVESLELISAGEGHRPGLVAGEPQ